MSPYYRSTSYDSADNLFRIFHPFYLLKICPYVNNMFLCLKNMFLSSYVLQIFLCQSVTIRFCLLMYHNNAATAVRKASKSLSGRLALSPSSHQMPGNTIMLGIRNMI